MSLQILPDTDARKFNKHNVYIFPVQAELKKNHLNKFNDTKSLTCFEFQHLAIISSIFDAKTQFVHHLFHLGKWLSKNFLRDCRKQM